MMRLFPLTLASLWNRRLTAGLTVVVIALSVSLLLGVERLRSDARASFASTVSGTDLIVGARSGPVQLLLYSVFHIGDATNEISWPAVQRIAARREVAWVVPLSLGDSHRGYRVVGTSADFFGTIATATAVRWPSPREILSGLCSRRWSGPRWRRGWAIGRVRGSRSRTAAANMSPSMVTSPFPWSVCWRQPALRWTAAFS